MSVVEEMDTEETGMEAAIEADAEMPIEAGPGADAEVDTAAAAETADETPAVRILGAALHVLDHRGSGLRLSEELLDLSGPAPELLSGYIVRSIQGPRARMARFKGAVTLTEASSVLGEKADLLAVSQAMARRLYEAMDATAAASGDLLVIHAVDDAANQPMLAILKLDLERGYRRELAEFHGRSTTRLTAIDDLLPGPDRRLQKCAFIPAPPHSLPYDLIVVDNQSGGDDRDPASYFTSAFLDCRLIDSPRELTKKLARETEQWMHEESFPPAAILDTREAVVRALQEPQVDLERLAADAFPDSEQRSRYLERLDSAGFEGGSFSTDRAAADRLSNSLTYVLDGGVRISGDAEAIANLLEVDSEPTGEGKVRIVIKSARFERKY